MSSPTFSSTQASLTEVRLYTELDPYYYTVDNRPLQDLQTNTGSLAASSDAARRGVLIEALKSSGVHAGLFGQGQSVVGLRATVASSSTVSVSPGAMMLPGALSTGDATTILRVASSHTPLTLNTPAPVTLGQEMTYVIQAKFTEFTNTTSYPNFDSTNTYLPSNLLNGYLTINAISGAQADSGTSTEPFVSPGFYPLYTVVSRAGSSPVIRINSSSPSRLVQTPVEEQWVEPALDNSWAPIGGYQAVQYKRVGSKVIIRGAMQGGTAASVAFTLPAGFRPISANGFAASNGGTGSVWVTVASTGEVTVATSTTTHLGIIEFYVD